MLQQHPLTPSSWPARVVSVRLYDEGPFPNNAELPALVYHGAFRRGEGAELAGSMERVFGRNGWGNGWRDGVYDVHHFHSTAHEVLGCYSGQARVQLGGPEGPVIELETRDVLVIPAGVAHKRVSSSPDFRVVGAYAGSADYDMNYGKIGERPAADYRIERVELPRSDPLLGREGPLLSYWL